eukprot:TRINITY_DN5014_c0_g1_i1.p1 TRINITY_DN5014_c0_g1~~TRINITY_DN5014_c0_g1_i1.p1  ORF type:complete len:277 (-),score=62.37 TRINITY_DN5014_c0_g1_i1:193-1023(-)
MVGIVLAVGSDVANVKVGQRVGVGWQYSSCGSCEWCDEKQEILCKNKINYMAKRGGFSEAVVWESRFVFSVPDNVANEHAGPLMCAGLTVFTALRLYLNTSAKKQQRVAIVGIGGLGHLGLQFANKLGAHVTALSTSSTKEQEAKSLGAHDFLNTTDAAAFEQSKGRFDLILNTISGDVEWDKYLELLRPLGKLCVVGVPKNPISFRAGNLLLEDKQIVGSLTGSSRDVIEMFEFVSRHGIKPLVEVLPVAEIDKAIEKVDKNTMRYRMVLQIAQS